MYMHTQFLHAHAFIYMYHRMPYIHVYMYVYVCTVYMMYTDYKCKVHLLEDGKCQCLVTSGCETTCTCHRKKKWLCVTVCSELCVHMKYLMHVHVHRQYVYIHLFSQ